MWLAGIIDGIRYLASDSWGSFDLMPGTDSLDMPKICGVWNIVAALHAPYRTQVSYLRTCAPSITPEIRCDPDPLICGGLEHRSAWSCPELLRLGTHAPALCEASIAF